jgi:hypothetical protein
LGGGVAKEKCDLQLERLNRWAEIL